MIRARLCLLKEKRAATAAAAGYLPGSYIRAQTFQLLTDNSDRRARGGPDWGTARRSRSKRRLLCVGFFVERIDRGTSRAIPSGEGSGVRCWSRINFIRPFNWIFKGERHTESPIKRDKETGTHSRGWFRIIGKFIDFERTTWRASTSGASRAYSLSQPVPVVGFSFRLPLRVHPPSPRSSFLPPWPPTWLPAPHATRDSYTRPVLMFHAWSTKRYDGGCMTFAIDRRFGNGRCNCKKLPQKFWLSLSLSLSLRRENPCPEPFAIPSLFEGILFQPVHLSSTPFAASGIWWNNNRTRKIRAAYGSFPMRRDAGTRCNYDRLHEGTNDGSLIRGTFRAWGECVLGEGTIKGFNSREVFRNEDLGTFDSVT